MAMSASLGALDSGSTGLPAFPASLERAGCSLPYIAGAKDSKKDDLPGLS